MMTAEYKRALRRAALRRAGSSAPAPVPIPAAVDEAEAKDAPWDAPAAAPAVAPPSAKRRKGLLGVVAAQQSTEVVDDGASRIDQDVQTEVERFNLISRDIITAGAEHKYYFSSERFNLRAFWADHKETLPLHYSVYVAEVGCKKGAAANVESVFSGAGKFTEEAKSARGTRCSRAWCGCTTTGSTPSSARRSRRWSSATWRSSTRRRPPVRRLRRSLRLERQARLPTRPPPRPRPQPPRKPEL